MKLRDSWGERKKGGRKTEARERDWEIEKEREGDSEEWVGGNHSESRGLWDCGVGFWKLRGCEARVSYLSYVSYAGRSDTQKHFL